MATAAVAVTAAGSEGTGSYTEIIAANGVTNDFCVYGVVVGGAGANAGNWNGRIGTGAAASEVQIGAFAGYDQTKLSGETCLFPVPLLVAANTRIAVALSNTNASGRTFGVRVLYYDGVL